MRNNETTQSLNYLRRRGQPRRIGERGTRAAERRRSGAARCVWTDRSRLSARRRRRRDREADSMGLTGYLEHDFDKPESSEIRRLEIGNAHRTPEAEHRISA